MHLERLAHAHSLASLLPVARALGISEGGWRLRVEDISAPEDAAPREAVLCALAQTINGEPALSPVEEEDSVNSLLLLRDRDLGYCLSRVVATQQEKIDGPESNAWQQRPVSRSAAVGYATARAALGLLDACSPPAVSPDRKHVIFDPCAGAVRRCSGSGQVWCAGYRRCTERWCWCPSTRH